MSDDTGARAYGRPSESRPQESGQAGRHLGTVRGRARSDRPENDLPAGLSDPARRALATFVCERLEGGHLTAIDRSAEMIQTAARRNAAYAETGKAEFLVATLEDLDLGDRRFDKIFAVRVGLFHREPERARGLVERWLAPGGALFVFFDPPSEAGTPQEPPPGCRS